MVRMTRIATSIYMLFVLYLVVYSQARCSDGRYTPDPKAPKPLTNINVMKKDKLPANWSEPALPPDAYRKALASSTAGLIALPAAVPDGLKRLHRLEAQKSVAPVDALLFAVTSQAQTSHDRANHKVRKTAMRAGGVPVYASNRGSSSSSYSHK
jgi:hypothetical protein